MQYAICEISGKQYRVVPDKEFLVDFLGEDQKEISVKALLIADNGKLTFGNPYLKEELKLTILEMVKKPKIRVAKFHAKANFRKVSGMRPKASKVILKSNKKEGKE